MSDTAPKQDDLILDYQIPCGIKEKIPEHFYYALGGELVSIFGKDVLLLDEDGATRLDYVAGTAGYAEALRMTCRKLDMDWLFLYWSELPWDQSDLFDGEIVDEVVRCFDQEGSANPYYKYLSSVK